MFNPTILGEFCVQETHLEERGKNDSNETSENIFESRGKGKGKLKGREKNNDAMNMEKEKIT